MDRRSPERKIDDKLKIELALARFEGGRTHTIEELATRFDRAPAVVSRAISAAFEEGLVEVRAVRSQVDRIKALESRLCRTFDLQGAVVVSSESSESNRIHETIGTGAGELLSTGTMIRDGDVVALGPGRGVFFTVRSVPEADLRAKGVVLVSLSGDSYPKYTTAPSILQNTRPDADLVVRQFATAFAYKVRPVVVSFPICGIEGAYEQVIAKTVFRGTSSGDTPAGPHDEDEQLVVWRTPSLSFLGVGQLNSDHSLWIKGAQTGREEVFVPTELKKLISELRTRTDGESIVADVAQVLFPVGDAARDDRLTDLLDKVNGTLIRVRLEQLQQSRSVCLVAGTKSKVSAMYAVITDLLQNQVRFICTDREAAEGLLRMKN